MALRTRRVLLATAVIALFCLGGWVANWYDHALLPWDGLFLIALSALCFGLMRLSKIGIPFAAAILITDVAHDPRLVHRQRILADGIHQILQVPLLLEQEVVGLMSFNSTQKQTFWPEDVELAHLLAKESLAEARRSVWTLHPLALESNDLPPPCGRCWHDLYLEQ